MTVGNNVDKQYVNKEKIVINVKVSNPETKGAVLDARKTYHDAWIECDDVGTYTVVASNIKTNAR